MDHFEPSIFKRKNNIIFQKIFVLKKLKAEVHRKYSLLHAGVGLMHTHNAHPCFNSFQLSHRFVGKYFAARKVITTVRNGNFLVNFWKIKGIGMNQQNNGVWRMVYQFNNVFTGFINVLCVPEWSYQNFDAILLKR